MEQHTNEWFKARLGKITGSAVSKIFGSSRKKDEKFGDTAKTYLYQIAAERLMNSQYIDIDEMFEYYLEQTNVSTKDMRWGNDQEPFARALYEKHYAKPIGITIKETGSIQDDERPFFASSPDGLMYHKEKIVGCIEIKCPNQATYMRYKTEITDAASLKAVKPEYYWQVLSHIMVTRAHCCDFVAYCPWQSDPLHVVRVLEDDVKDDIEALKTRLDEAEAFLAEIGAGYEAETPAGEAAGTVADKEPAVTEDAQEPPFPDGLREWPAEEERPKRNTRRSRKPSSYEQHIEDE